MAFMAFFFFFFLKPINIYQIKLVISLFKSSRSLLIFASFFFPVEKQPKRRMFISISPTSIVDLFIFPFNPINIYFLYLKLFLLDAHTLRIFVFPLAIFFFLPLFRVALRAYGGSQARGSNWSCSHRPTPQLQQRTWSLMIPSWIRFCCTTTGTSKRFQVWSLASLSGLRIQCCHELWCRPQMRLRSGVAEVAAYTFWD